MLSLVRASLLRITIRGSVFGNKLTRLYLPKHQQSC